MSSSKTLETVTLADREKVVRFGTSTRAFAGERRSFFKARLESQKVISKLVEGVFSYELNG